MTEAKQKWLTSLRGLVACIVQVSRVWCHGDNNVFFWNTFNFRARVRLGSIWNKNNWNSASKRLFGSYSHSGIPGFPFRLFCSQEQNSNILAGMYSEIYSHSVISQTNAPLVKSYINKGAHLLPRLCLVTFYLLVALTTNSVKMAASESDEQTGSRFSHAETWLIAINMWMTFFFILQQALPLLAITGYGARGNTRAEIMKVLHLDSILPTDLNNSVRKWIDALSAASSKHNKLLTANRLFVQKRFEILETYRKGTSEFYDAKLAQVGYIRNVDRSTAG